MSKKTYSLQLELALTCEIHFEKNFTKKTAKKLRVGDELLLELPLFFFFSLCFFFCPGGGIHAQKKKRKKKEKTV